MEINSIYIIKRDTGVCLYHKDFTESAFDPQLLSSFLVAMTSFFDEATRSVTSQARAFEGTHYKIIVEFGEWTLGAVSTKEDTADTRTKLRRLIERFEEQFNVLRWVDIDLAVHTRFEQSVIDEFVRSIIHSDTIITVRPEWKHYTKKAEVISFLRLIPSICSVKEAAEFLEIPLEVGLNLAAEALWEKAITVDNPVKPDDIYQAMSITGTNPLTGPISPETVRTLTEFDGETPISIAAERLKTADLKRFLDDVALLEKRKMIELVSPAHSVAIRYTSALQSLLKNCANIIGLSVMRSVFLASKQQLVANYPWLAFVSLEEGVDIELRSSLTAATIRGTISPDVINDGFRVLLQFVTKKVKDLLGSNPINRIVTNTRREIQNHFPSTAYEIEWEYLTALKSS
ncbi:MAG: hypothetical protein AM326_09770 [Candidatus Thorarchaeota archaeon SMTZ-45]|nr:MAG: hypothetical protein AM325_09655 [Candidatus Thorarchaeota archaeon SMTZ1-45]KXH74638.1 MAG: hypothetical protein AM326_09770 [Candidatus Thorarchaeota archaeon SMTZ-45]